MLPSEHPEPTGATSLSAKVMFVMSAAVAALALRLAWDEPFAGVLALIGIGAVVLGRYLSRRRTRRLLRSGDVETIISRWSTALRDVPHSETMGPLMTATAFAAHGWVDRARDALRAAERGPAWEAALEHRLFVKTLLLTFEGHNDRALETAAELGKLPLPKAGPLLVDRVRVLRSAVAALARAFSHQGEAGDRKLLLAASHASPLVHWAMRYGAAILSIDRGDLGHAQALLQGAPRWPSESRFHAFHHELEAEVRRRALAGDEVDAVDAEEQAPPSADVGRPTPTDVPEPPAESAPPADSAPPAESARPAESAPPAEAVARPSPAQVKDANASAGRALVDEEDRLQ